MVLPKGTRVRTTKDAGSKDWSDPDRPGTMWGVWGTIIEHSDSHGLVYHVKHDGWGESWYEREELETLRDLDNFTPIRIKVIASRIGYEQSDKLRQDILNTQIDSGYLLELVKQYDVMLLFRDGEIQVRLDRQGARWRQM